MEINNEAYRNLIIMENIKQRMSSINLSQHDLAEKLGVTETSVSRWLSGKQVPKFTDFLDIMNALDLVIHIDTAENIAELINNK